MEILLMTGTIKPYCQIKYNNVQQRLEEYERNIERYIVESDFEKIVFAENSGYPFLKEKYYKLAETHGKEFEYLDVSKNAQTDNISVGEAQIIKDALEESKLLRLEEYFWKVSGRIYIENINKIINKSYGGKNIFLYAPKYNSIQTWLFKIEKNILKKYFLQPVVFENMRMECIEYAWKKCWNQNKKDIIISRFPVYPDVKGTNSSGNKYSMSRGKWYLKQILLKFNYYTVK